MNDIVTASVQQLSKRSLGDLVIAGRRAIEEAGSFDEVKAVAAQADALKAFSRSIGASDEAINAAAEIKVRAERRMGEALASRDRPKTGPATVGELGNMELPNSTPTLSDIGVTKMQSSRWQALAAIPEDAFDAALQAHQNVSEPISAADNKVSGVQHNGDGTGFHWFNVNYLPPSVVVASNADARVAA